MRILKSLGGENIAGFVIKTADSDESLEIYSPGTDSWSSCSVDAATFWPDVRRDFISYYDLAAQGMRLFDGVTGVEVQLPGGRIDADYSQDDFQIYHQYDGNWVGYSAHTRSVSEFPGDRYPYISADGSVVLMHDFLDQPRYYALTYNALYSCFVPLTLTEEQGHCVDILPGGRTALLLTKNGCLFAFDPHRSPSDCCVDRVGNVDCDSQDNADIADVQDIVQHLYLTLEPFCCPEEADLDYSGTIDIGDLTMLITSLYITLEPLNPCP